MNLKELTKEVPFKWRVQSYSKNKPKCTCVAYLDARQVMSLLDEVCGVHNWQCEYYEMKGNLFCRIGIKIGDEWVWKSDCGTESNVDAEKGEASDSFKRAAVKWGIGRFLYEKEMVYLDANEVKKGNNYPYPVDQNGKRIWDVNKHINSMYPVKKQQSAPAPKVQKEKPSPEKKEPDNDKLVQTLLQGFESKKTIQELEVSYEKVKTMKQFTSVPKETLEGLFRKTKLNLVKDITTELFNTAKNMKSLNAKLKEIESEFGYTTENSSWLHDRYNERAEALMDSQG